jgi:2-polyprenyl-3-methyl-5-hydroxy-6-metoxy-1,4-benzoquinol methylase
MLAERSGNPEPRARVPSINNRDMQSHHSELIAAGHYARKQIFSRSRLVAWSHGSRFKIARQLAAPYAGSRLLDYGCGDGTFLALVHDLFPCALGVDVDSTQIAGCAQRFAGLDGLSFGMVHALASPEYTGRYDVVLCMEVLEHCPADVQRRVIDDLARVCSRCGTVIVSVPIEIGPALAAKQAARAFAAARGLIEYASRERYTTAELARMVFAGASTAMPREETVVELDDGTLMRFTGHKGFNWRALERVIETRFVIERRMCSPLPVLGAWLNSQVWFVLRPRLGNGKSNGRGDGARAKPRRAW